MPKTAARRDLIDPDPGSTSTPPSGALASFRPSIDPLTRATAILRARRRRNSFLPGVEFGEPAWDMLLELFVVGHTRKRISVSSLCLASGVPPTTALRTLTLLAEDGQLIRERDPEDRRRVFVKLAPSTRTRLERWLSGFDVPTLD